MTYYTLRSTLRDRPKTDDEFDLGETGKLVFDVPLLSVSSLLSFMLPCSAGLIGQRFKEMKQIVEEKMAKLTPVLLHFLLLLLLLLVPFSAFAC